MLERDVTLLTVAALRLFEGKYGYLPRGIARTWKLRSRARAALYRQIRNCAGDVPRDISTIGRPYRRPVGG